MNVISDIFLRKQYFLDKATNISCTKRFSSSVSLLCLTDTYWQNQNVKSNYFV